MSFQFSSSSHNESFSQVWSSSSSLSKHGGISKDRISISKPTSFSCGSSIFDPANDYKESIINLNGKETMQNLNDRLASYLEQVRSLEEANVELETKIKEWHLKKSTKSKRDYSAYEKAIADLQGQLLDGHMNGGKLTLQMENAKLASDDFKRKFETEKHLRVDLETDLEGLRKVMDNLTIVRTDLEMEIEGMRKHIIYMRMGHEEDMKVAQFQRKDPAVDVKVDAAPSEDLAKVIANMRKEYEALIEKSRKEAEEWYNKQSTTVQKEVDSNTMAWQSSRDQVKEIKRTLQTLEIELQAEIRKKHGLQNSLAEAKAISSEQLQKIQTKICSLEDELRTVRSELERQNNEHTTLLNIKTRLENEIATYRQLLEGINT
ncbi:hypothetical protein GDO86_014239, partial [Hymenochirus boettgeri]